MRTRSPSGDSAPNSSRASVGPSTANDALSPRVHLRQEAPLRHREPPRRGKLVRDAVDVDAAPPRLRPRPAPVRRRPARPPRPRARAAAPRRPRSSACGSCPRTRPECRASSTLPGLISIRLVPNWVNCDTMYRRVPSPSEVSRMTAATPIATPSAESAERRRCPVRAPSTKRKSSTVSTVTSSPARPPGRGASRAAPARRRTPPRPRATVRAPRRPPTPAARPGSSGRSPTKARIAPAPSASPTTPAGGCEQHRLGEERRQDLTGPARRAP